MIYFQKKTSLCSWPVALLLLASPIHAQHAADPPKGAIVLFDGKDLSQWESARRPAKGEKAPLPAGWKVENGYLETVSKSGDILTRQSFRDYQLHLEFWLAEGGNSGVYLHGFYDLEIRDTHKQKTLSHSMSGGLYNIAAPKVNAAGPPETWQVLDITFRAARFDADSKLLRKPRISARYNGQVVHEEVEFDPARRSAGCLNRDPAQPAGPIMLQDHDGGVVRFRNIWLTRLDSDEGTLPERKPASLRRLMYVAADSFRFVPPSADNPRGVISGIRDASIRVHDIDDGHKLVKTIQVPNAGDYKGMCASPATGMLYLSSRHGDQLIALDLRTDEVAWRLPLGKDAYPDSMAITPDGKLIYLPLRNRAEWHVIDTEKRQVVASIKIDAGDVVRGKKGDKVREPGPHNTVSSLDGKRMYLQSLGVHTIHVADTATHQIVRKIGPFSNGVRPFAVSKDEAYLFANVDGLLGFEVADVKSGKVLHRLEAKTPPERMLSVKISSPWHLTPSHGINLRPDQKEVWVSNDVYGLVHVWDVSSLSPKHVADIPLYSKPDDYPRSGWIMFSLDGRYCYACCTDAVIDTQTKKIVARMRSAEKMIEIDFEDGKPVRAGQR